MSKVAKCYQCEETLDKNAIGLSKKLLGNSATRCYCISCLSNYLDTTVDDLLAKIQDFKDQGCTLFL